jgi:hypothetical protein
MHPLIRPLSIFNALMVFIGCANVEKSLLATINTTADTAARNAVAASVASPYAAWSNGPSAAPNYFPIGVWLQDPANALAYRDIGVNLYVGLWQGPTEVQLEALKSAGMRVICPQNEVGRRHLDDYTIAAWMHGDEPDNAQRQDDGSWGPAVPPADLQANYEQWRSNDPTRPIWLNLGQGVANDDWVGRAAPDEYYPAYIRATDIVSFDVYPIAGIRRSDGENYLWLVAQGVERLRDWGTGQPVWSVIETTRINSDRKATPDQVRAQVWLALVHGAKGIVYFAHEWQPRFVEAGLLADEQMRLGVAQINAQIHRLAPALNAADAEPVMAVSADPQVPLATMAKKHGEDLYLFAVPRLPGQTRATFTLPSTTGQIVEVIDEDRTLVVENSQFSDDFSTHQVHLYRIGTE